MKRYFSIDSISEEMLEDEYWEGKFDCVFQLMATNSTETEEQACERLNIDYQMFCKWKKQSDQEYNLQIVRKLRRNLFLITGCKCQYKNAQKVENKNVRFPGSIPQLVLP